MKTPLLLLSLSAVLLSPTAQAQAPSPAAPDAEYSYSPLGKRDPFQALSTRSICQPERQVLTLVGVVWGMDAPQALVTTDKGESLVLTEGMYLSDYSQVVQISEAGLVREWTLMGIDSTITTEQETLALVQP